MKFSLTICAVIVNLVLLLTAILVQASDHTEQAPNHSAALVDISTAQTNAKDIISNLINNNKLSHEWIEAKVISTEKKIFSGNTEWVIVFFNSKADNKDKQKIYVFLSLAGEYIAVNFTGM